MGKDKEVKTIQVKITDATGSMFLRQTLGKGEGNGLKFQISTNISDSSLIVEIQDEKLKAEHLYLVTTSDLVTAICSHHLKECRP